MLVRAAIVMASMFMAGQTLAADTINAANTASVDNTTQVRVEPRSKAQVVIAPPGFGQLTDRASALHAQELKRIAVYAAIGNRDGAEILSGQLRQFGVTREEMQDAVDRTQLHDDGTGAPLARSSRVGLDDNPATKVSY